MLQSRLCLVQCSSLTGVAAKSGDLSGRNPRAYRVSHEICWARVGGLEMGHGEEVVAVIIARGGAEESELTQVLDAFIRTRIAKNRVPREYAFVSELPHGPSGKVLKRSLRQSVQDGSLVVSRV